MLSRSSCPTGAPDVPSDSRTGQELPHIFPSHNRCLPIIIGRFRTPDWATRTYPSLGSSAASEPEHPSLIRLSPFGALAATKTWNESLQRASAKGPGPDSSSVGEVVEALSGGERHRVHCGGQSVVLEDRIGNCADQYCPADSSVALRTTTVSRGVGASTYVLSTLAP